MTLHISKKLVWSILYGFILSSILIFILQFVNEINCQLIPIRQIFADYDVFDEYNLQIDNYIVEKENELINSPKKSNGSLEEFYLGNSEERELENLKIWNKARNKRLQYIPIQIDSCQQQAYTDDYITFFGDTVANNFQLKSKSKVYSYSEKEIKNEYPNTIVHPDQYLSIEDYSKLIGERQIPKLITETRYRVFEDRFTQCDCLEFSNTTKLRFNAFMKDWEFVLIFGIVIGMFIHWIRTKKFKIILTK